MKPPNGGAEGEVKSCKKCNSSLPLSPSDKEVKRGVVDTQLYCCNKKARVLVGKETFPQICEQVRMSPRLCGSTARWWTPAELQSYDLAVKVAARKSNGATPVVPSVPPYRARSTEPKFPRKVVV